ncbi:MAG: Gfo/Idh/MocA family oxidoreductase [Planctomycetota bacterium]
MTAPLRVLYLGASRRIVEMFDPIVRALPAAEPVGVWSRSEQSAARMGETLDLPCSNSLDELIERTTPDAAIVCVNAHANGIVGLDAANRGLHLLLETPLAFDVAEADAIIEAATSRGITVEVAEQFHRRPMERIKLACLDAGLFGTVNVSISDHEGHGYHGVSVMRSYLGFDARPVSVAGFTAHFPLASHRSEQTEEHQEHAFVRFEDGRLGVFHWTSVGYDCPIRSGLGGRFFAERGSWETIRDGADLHQHVRVRNAQEAGNAGITVERIERDGILHTVQAHVHDGSNTVIEWTNPFAGVQAEQGLQWSDDMIGVAQCVDSLVRAVRSGSTPDYGMHQARIDQVVTNAIYDSARAGGAPRPIDA